MSLAPKVIKTKSQGNKTCTKCDRTLNTDTNFVKSNSWLFVDKHSPICNDCIKKEMIRNKWTWDAVDKLCQQLNIPFIPNEFVRLHDINGDDVFPIYAQVFVFEEYDRLEWNHYYQYYKALKENHLLENELPEIHEHKILELQKIWGADYEQEQLEQLERLFNGMLATQSVNGALQIDQARKVCKMSLLIDEQMRAGQNVDKLVASYDKMIKVAEFTPKNTKNENDLNSFGEAFAWMEKRGWVNTYFDGVSKDVVDEVSQNLQAFNRRLYTGESGIGEDITSRLEALSVADELEHKEDIFNLGDEDFDLDKYEDEGYENIIQEELDLDIHEEDEETRRI